MQLINDAGNGEVICKEIALSDIKAATSPLAQKILELLAKEPLHASRIAKELKEEEQKIYYHTRQLVKAGLLAVHHTEDSQGGLAKVLALKTPSFAVRFRPFDP